MNFDHCINNKNWKFRRKLIRQKKKKKIKIYYFKEDEKSYQKYKYIM